MAPQPSSEPSSRALAAKFGIQVATMTFPGRLYLLDTNRDRAGDLENSNGSARTPLWSWGTRITKEPYTIAQNAFKRASYGTIIFRSHCSCTGLCPHPARLAHVSTRCRSFFSKQE